MIRAVGKKKRRKNGNPSHRICCGATCGCSVCLRRQQWPLHYTGLVPPLDSRGEPVHAKTTNRRRRLSFECWLEENDLVEFIGGEPVKSDRQAKREGLTVRNPRRRSIWAPLMQGVCERCEGLRIYDRRFCLQCESLMKRELVAAGWSAEQMEKYLKAGR